MIRLHFVVEGQTEEEFVNSVLAQYLTAFDISVDVRCLETGRRRGRIYRGGIRRFGQLRNDLELWMRQDNNPDAWFTTMVDLYGYPRDAPGYDEAGKIGDPVLRVKRLEEALGEDLGHRRFVPYLQLHEFEALLLADPQALDRVFMDHGPAIRRLCKMVVVYTSSELIDDGEATAPSKRIITEIPEYEGRKASAGPLVAAKIGLPKLCASCPHFAEWLGVLEKLPLQKDA
ncbi:MAG TPA: DUF4276 family protein [Armatimonadota bacterium]|nr:DUF4276 family protein [Armatimonadota bacterium]